MQQLTLPTCLTTVRHPSRRTDLRLGKGSFEASLAQTVVALVLAGEKPLIITFSCPCP